VDLGFVLFLLGKHEEALEEFREVLRVDPRLARASSGLGMTLVRLGKVDEAISATTRPFGSPLKRPRALWTRPGEA